jgi:hypothetical protein
VVEGSTATNNGAVSDVNGDIVALSASVGNVANNSDGTWSWSFVTTDGPDESQIVTITANDGQGGLSTAQFTLVVLNAAPEVQAGADTPVVLGETLVVNATFTDPSPVDTHTATIDFGAGTGPAPATVGDNRTVSGSFQYFMPGTYTVTVCVTDDDGETGCDDLVAQVNWLSVMIDIKPGSYPNSINLGSGGSVPVAIFSTPTFDATTVDPTSVTLAKALVQLKGKGTPMASAEDVNGDGLPDLVVHVSTQALQLTGADVNAVLEGVTTAGVYIRGTDTVRIIEPDDDHDGIGNSIDNCIDIANSDQADADADGLGNACDSTPNGDNDGDGVDNLADNCVDSANLDQTDTDGDGWGDACDLCSADPTKVVPGVCDCGAADSDSDGDGTADCNDQCPADPAKLEPGVCGCSVADTDSNGDGTADCNDNCLSTPNPGQTDSDADGVGDACDPTPNG